MSKHYFAVLIVIALGITGYVILKSPTADNREGNSFDTEQVDAKSNQTPAHDGSGSRDASTIGTSLAAGEISSSASYTPIDSLSPGNSQLVDRAISNDVSELRELALAGAPDAAYDLYRIFASCSVGTKAEYCTTDTVDVSEGISMLRRSAELEYWPARVEFLRALYVHQGPPSQDDIELGMEFLKLAVDDGAADAMYRIADFSINLFDFTMTYESDNLPGDLSRTEAYGHLLAAGSVYEDLGIRPNVVAYINRMNTQLGPREVAEALEDAKYLLGRPGCCKVWKP